MIGSGPDMVADNQSTPARNVPEHVAIIMDGNGRWAQARGLPRIKGHEAGTENIRRITARAGELGISYLTLWAFSTDNWSRPRRGSRRHSPNSCRDLSPGSDELHQRARIRHIESYKVLDPTLVEQRSRTRSSSRRRIQASI
ncbi:MAG: undecaprenyl diphosphate synthase family protein [Thermomicrobiales bacterium]